MANKITLEDLKNIQPIKVSKDAKSASLMVLGAVKAGKTTFIHDLYKDKVLFIATERRHNFLADAHVINIENWSNYLQVMKLIKDPAIQEKYDAICVDTFTRLQEWCEKYTLNNLNIDDLGDLPYGAGHGAFKKEMAKGIELLEKSGFYPHVIVHTKTATMKVPVESVNDEDVTDAMSLVKDKKTGKQYYEYNKQVADLKESTFNALNRMCDNILFLDVAKDINGNEERRIYYRNSMEHVAGSSLKFMVEHTPLSAEAYLQAFKEAVEKEGNDHTTDSPKELPKESDTQYDYNELMKEVATLGNSLKQNGKEKELTMTIEETLGKGRKVKDLNENQGEVLSVLVEKLKDLV